MSATLLPAKGSPPAADGTELAVRPSVCEVIDDQGSGVVTFDRETVESLLASGRFFWLAGPVAATRRGTRPFGLRLVSGGARPWRRVAVEMGPLPDSPAACARRRWQ